MQASRMNEEIIRSRYRGKGSKEYERARWERSTSAGVDIVGGKMLKQLQSLQMTATECECEAQACCGGSECILN
jgi:hypothetical protein